MRIFTGHSVFSVYFSTGNFCWSDRSADWFHRRDDNQFSKKTWSKTSISDKQEVGELADSIFLENSNHGGTSYLHKCSGILFVVGRTKCVCGKCFGCISLVNIGGFADDYLKISRKYSGGLSGSLKLLGQGITTVVVCVILFVPLAQVMAGVDGNPLGSETKMREIWVPFYKEPVFQGVSIVGIFLFFLITLTGSSNAINLTDGLDGLAIGCTVTVALTYGIMAYASGNFVIADYLMISWIPGTGELTVLCASLLGGSLAFLWYNAHPAEIFMGDTGSLAIGGLVGIIALMVHQPFTLIIVGGIFVIEAGSVILQVASFKTRGKRIFKMSPIHHHFELKGWKETKVVIRFWILSLLFALFGLATLKLR